MRLGSGSVVDVLAERALEREALLALAREYVERLSSELPVVAATIVGSVARGDFNVWSDVDVVVIAERLPTRAPDRAQALGRLAPARVQPIGFTPAEFRTARTKGNQLVRDACTVGVPLAGAEFFAPAVGD
jgi:predicted nucleotidyltransferase